MKELLEELIPKGFKSQIMLLNTIISLIIDHDDYKPSTIHTLLILEEIKAWFREEHKIHVSPLYKANDEYQANIYINYHGSVLDRRDTSKYEIALLDSIKAAVKLI